MSSTTIDARSAAHNNGALFFLSLLVHRVLVALCPLTILARPALFAFVPAISILLTPTDIG